MEGTPHENAVKSGQRKDFSKRGKKKTVIRIGRKKSFSHDKSYELLRAIMLGQQRSSNNDPTIITSKSPKIGKKEGGF